MEPTSCLSPVTGQLQDKLETTGEQHSLGIGAPLQWAPPGLFPLGLNLFPLEG